MVGRVLLLAVIIFLLVVLDEGEAFWRKRCSAKNCAVSSWSSWSSCCSPCMGTQTRTRAKIRTESCGGSCPFPLRQTKSCNTVCQNGGFRVRYGPCRCRSGFTGRCCEIGASCQEGRVKYNKCGDRCKCRGGKLTECTRIRKEFTTMTTAEQTKYVNTVKVASTDARYKAEYDKLLTLHKTLFNEGIHKNISFLPWHRWFIFQYENLLRKVDCAVTVPYWDWSRVAANAWRGLPSDVWYSGCSGFGGNGTPCVLTGPFNWPAWQLLPSAGYGCLQREFNSYPPDTIAVQQILNTPISKFGDFEFQLRSCLHDNVHCRIGGTMCIEDAASAPEFFLHHGFVDKLWADWQAKSSRHRDVYFSTLSHVMAGTPHTPRDFLDLTAHPGGVRVEYKPVPSPFVGVGVQNFKELHAVMGSSRPPFTIVNERAMNLFRLSPGERKKIREMAKELDPVPSGRQLTA